MDKYVIFYSFFYFCFHFNYYFCFYQNVTIAMLLFVFFYFEFCVCVFTFFCFSGGKRFEKQFEDLDVQSQYVEQTMNQTTTLSTPQVKMCRAHDAWLLIVDNVHSPRVWCVFVQDEVDALIGKVADDHNLDLTGALGCKLQSKPLFVFFCFVCVFLFCSRTSARCQLIFCCL